MHQSTCPRPHPCRSRPLWTAPWRQWTWRGWRAALWASQVGRRVALKAVHVRAHSWGPCVFTRGRLHGTSVGRAFIGGSTSAGQLLCLHPAGGAGLSVEQRKRLSIAVELVANPSVRCGRSRECVTGSRLCSIQLGRRHAHKLPALSQIASMTGIRLPPPLKGGDDGRTNKR